MSDKNTDTSNDGDGDGEEADEQPEVIRKVAFEAGEEMAVETFDVDWSSEFAQDLTDAVFSVVAEHRGERFIQNIRDHPEGVKCTSLELDLTVHEGGDVEVIVPQRYIDE